MYREVTYLYIENRVIADGNPVPIPYKTDATSTAETWPVRMSPRKVYRMRFHNQGQEK
jgi:hypothetical protein